MFQGEQQGHRKGWMYVCGCLPGCAYEGGNKEEARVVGLLHVPRELRRVGDAGLLEPPERPQGSPASFSVWMREHYADVKQEKRFTWSPSKDRNATARKKKR